MVDFGRHLRNPRKGREDAPISDSDAKRIWPLLTGPTKITPERKAEISRLISMYGLSRAGHSLFSPSSSAGWLNCRGFLLANAGKPDVAGEDAAYGTVAHGIAATWLTAIRDEGRKKARHVPDRFLGFVGKENGYLITCDTYMLHHIERYIDWCHEVEIEGDVFIEQRVQYSEYMPIPNQGGTADHFVCVSPTIDQDGNVLTPGRLIITDLKMGMGVWVDVVRNTQAMLYALGVFLEWDWVYHFEVITIRICQPRLDYFGVWECTREDLLAFGEEVRIKADEAWVEDAPRTPGEKQCRWCADKLCGAKSALLEDLADDLFDDDDVIEGKTQLTYSAKDLDVHAMTPLFGPLEKAREPRFSKQMAIALMAWRYSHKAMFTKFFEETGEALLQLARAGEHVPGLKIVDGKRSFAWCDPEDAAQELSIAGLKEADIFKVEVTSVSNAKKLLTSTKLLDKEQITKLFDGEPARKVGRRIIDAKPGLVRTTAGKQRLVPSGDNRIDVQDDTDDAFDDDDDL